LASDPRAAALAAVAAAARAHAPGLLASDGPMGRGGAAYPSPTQRSGRWVRRGRKIVLYGV